MEAQVLDEVIERQFLLLLRQKAQEGDEYGPRELILEGGYAEIQKELEAAVEAKTGKQPGINVLRKAVRRVVHELMGDGLLIPGPVDQSYDWGHNQFRVTFSLRGIEWARSKCRVQTEPHEILDAVQAVHADHPGTVTSGCVALAQEALHCIETRCFRAAVVMVGVAAEEATGQLMDCLCGLKSYTKAKGWKDLNDTAKAFAPRWAGARLVLSEVKQRIKPQLPSPRPDWWSLWENLPESLVPLGEAVRISRNTAAHDADHKFTYLQAATLLCGLPHQLRWIAEIQDHIQNPRDGVNPD